MDEQTAAEPAPAVESSAPTNGDAGIKEGGPDKVAGVTKGEEPGGKAKHGFSKQAAAEILRQVRGFIRQ